MGIPKAECIWMNGRMVPWDEAKVHVLVHALHFGTSVFEGVRAYATPGGPAIFRLSDHVDRLFYSCKLLHMTAPLSKEEMTCAILETVRANQHKTCYIRPLIFGGYGDLALHLKDTKVDVIIATWERDAYYGAEALTQGLDVVVSSWRRLAPGTLPNMAKIGGHYVNSQLAAGEANALGFDEAIMLDVNGFASEGPGENLFLVHRGVIYTPPLSGSILPGITRDSVLTLAQELDYPVREEYIPREMLYLAEEVFMTGTVTEVMPVRSVDRIPVGDGKRGPVTKALQDSFFAIASGEVEDRHRWLTLVGTSAASSPN